MESNKFEYKVMSTESGASLAGKMPKLNYMGLDSKIGGGAYSVLYNIGGATDGYITFPVNVSQPGKYYMVVNYMLGDGRKGIKIDVNGVNTGTVYVLPMTYGSSAPSTYTIPLNLTQTENIINLHGDGKNIAPSIVGVVIILSGTTMQPSAIYNVAAGKLSNGAIINKETGFATKLGGVNKGVSTINNINSPQTGKFILAIKYLNIVDNSQFKITINNTVMGPYTLPKTVDNTVANASVFTLPVNLNIGGFNTIVYSGNGTLPAPDLELFTLTTMPPAPPSGSFTVAGNLEGSASFGTGMLQGYIVGIGGPLDGATTAVFTVNYEGLYIISLTYKNSESKSQSLMIDVNEEKGTIPYLLENVYPSIVRFVVKLKAGENKLRFYGENKKLAPNLAYFNFYSATTSIPEFDTATGTLKKAIKDDVSGFVKDIGGTNMGSVIVNVAQIEKGRYDLVINYLSGDVGRSFRVKVNNFDTGIVYNALKTIDFNSSSASTFTLPININSDKNTIEFLGNGTKPAPYLGKFKLVPIAPASQAGTYNVSSGFLENGAVMGVKDLNPFAINLGGTTNGSSTVTINGATAGNYNLVLMYRNIFAVSLPLALDVNGTKSGDYSLLPSFNGKINIPVTLNVGANKVKFYGDGTKPVPYLLTFTLVKK